MDLSLEGVASLRDDEPLSERLLLEEDEGRPRCCRELLRWLEYELRLLGLSHERSGSAGHACRLSDSSSGRGASDGSRLTRNEPLEPVDTRLFFSCSLLLLLSSFGPLFLFELDLTLAREAGAEPLARLGLAASGFGANEGGSVSG